jgi:transcriptional regulator with XRE-family HTH domain
MMTRLVYLDGVKLKRLRVIKGFSQRALGVAADISPSTINLLEHRGKTEGFHPQTLVKLAAALGVEPTELLGEDED